MNTRVVNIYKEDCDVYIGRPGKGQSGYFGNPVRTDGADRGQVLQSYRQYFYERLAKDPDFKSRISALKGKRLGCFCYPKMCHGMIIVEYLDGITVEQQMAAPQEERSLDCFDDSDELTS